MELKLFGMDVQMREGFEDVMKKLEEIRELLSEREVESEREDREKDGDGKKDEEMVVENEVTEVGEDSDMAENCICTDFAIFTIISAELKMFCTLIQATN